MKKFLIALGVLAMSITPCFAAHWVQIGRGNYVDSDSVTSQNDKTYHYVGRYFVYWTKQVADESPIKLISNKPVWSQRSKVLVDCETRQLRKLSYFAYDSDNNEIVNNKKADGPWENPAANTADGEGIRFVCSGAYYEHSGNHRHYWYFGDRYDDVYYNRFYNRYRY